MVIVVSKIDIIVPLFNDYDNLENLLINVCKQTIKDDLCLCIVDDKSDISYDDLIDKYSMFLNIKYFKLDENVGSGLARQYGFLHTDSDYVFYLDSDDLIMYHDSMEILFSHVNEEFDLVCGFTYYEKLDEYLSLDVDLHGKLYKRKFLIDHNIFFNETRFHEDNAYNNLVLINEPRIEYINNCVYYYRNNNNSITSVDDELEFKRLKIFLYNFKYVLDKTSHLSNYYKDNFIYTKLKYINKRFNEFSEDKKEMILKWFKEYDLDYIKYLYYTDSSKIKEEIITHGI